jgi:putative glutamine amidotransferase
MRRWKLFALLLIASCVVSQPAWASSSAKPIIGINVDVDEGVSKDASVLGPYYEAIEKSGGIPVLIPPMPEEDLRTLLKTLDGVMLIGGWDYPPDFYGQKVDPSDHVMDARRANFDKLLIKTLVKDTELPVLGICAGSQILNIAQGGDLIQDIPSAKPESKVSHRHHMENGVNKHIVVFTPGTKLAALYTVKELSVPAAHHQAVGKIGDGLTKAAQSEDGVTEAVEMDSKPFVIGVQYHPERDYDNNKALFAAFIEQAKHSGTAK